jgi:transcriptional regulator with XRE-family HTH domain
VRVRKINLEHSGPGETFRIACACGAFTRCHVAAALPATCSLCSRPLPDGIAARLAALRPLRGISIPETAAALSVSSKTIRDWECGRAHVPAAKRSMLASLLRVAQDLLCERADPTIPPGAAAGGGPSLVAAAPSADGHSKPKVARTVRAPAAASRGTMFVVELTCLLCARELGTLESSVWPTAAPVALKRPGLPAATITDWRRLRCETCGGSAITDEVRERVARNEGPIDWSADKPRRGRPPKAVAEARANRRGSAA